MSTLPQQDQANEPTPRKSRRTTVLVVLAAVAIVALPLVFSEGRREIARWHQADAEEKILDGDLEGAIESLNEAIEWNNALELYLVRARLKLMKEDFAGCVEDCDAVIEMTQAGPVAVAMMASSLRGQANLELEDYVAAVEDQKAVGELLKKNSSLMKRSTYLNGLSYARALGGIELEEAAKDADKAVELLGSDGQVTSAVLRATISSDWEPASPVLKEVVSYIKHRLEGQTDKTKQQIYDEIVESFPPSNRSTAKVSRLAEHHLDVSEQLWLLKQRLALSAVVADDKKKSSEDEALKTALNELPKLEVSYRILSEFAPILDTRGFVSYKLAVTGESEKRAERLEAARKDLDLAVVAMEACVQVERVLAIRYQGADLRSAKADLKRAEQSLAVIRYHRALLLDELGEDQLAARDRSRVKQLGHEPNEGLH